MATAKGRLMRSRIIFTLCFISVLVGEPKILTNMVVDAKLQIYIMDFDGSNMTQLTFGDSSAMDIQFTPDGQKIAYKQLHILVTILEEE